MKNIKPRMKYQSISLTEEFIAEIKEHIIDDRHYKSIADFTRAAIREKMKIDIEIRDMKRKGKGTFYDYDLDEQMIFKHGKWMRVVPNPKKKKNKNIDETDKETNPIEDKLDQILTLLVNGKNKKIEKNGFRG